MRVLFVTYALYIEIEYQLALAEFQRDLRLWADGLVLDGANTPPPNFPEYSLDARIQRDIRRTYGVN